MVTLTVILFGAIAYRALPVNLLPDLSYPTLTVRTEYTGAAPSEIETLITEPVEEAVGVVKGLRKPQLDLAHGPERRDPGVRLGHRHGPHRPGGARQA